MRACSTGVFGSCLLLCALTIGAIRGGGVKNCALPLESEHESRMMRSRQLSQARTSRKVVSDGSEDDVCGVVLGALKVATAEMAVSLHVATRSWVRDAEEHYASATAGSRDPCRCDK